MRTLRRNVGRDVAPRSRICRTVFLALGTTVAYLLSFLWLWQGMFWLMGIRPEPARKRPS